ncbi:MAG: hypothetical protein HKL88_02530 [Bacteroidia bacterium]|nr:hypothetical protein [Bacteroidia bacterium]
METVTIKEAEALKDVISKASKKSKETMNGAIGLNSKRLSSAVESNRTNFEALNSLLYNTRIDPSAISSVKTLLEKEAELMENISAALIDSFTRRMNLSIDFTSNVLNMAKNQTLYTKDGRDRISNLLQNNFKSEADLSAKDFEKIVSLLVSQLNTDLKLNTTIAENMASQMVHLSDMQNKNFENLFTWNEFLTPWWAVDGNVSKNG